MKTAYDGIIVRRIYSVWERLYKRSALFDDIARY